MSGTSNLPPSLCTAQYRPLLQSNLSYSSLSTKSLLYFFRRSNVCTIVYMRPFRQKELYGNTVVLDLCRLKNYTGVHKRSLFHQQSVLCELGGHSFREGGSDYNRDSEDEENKDHHNYSWKNSLAKEPSLLLSLIQEVKPLDVSQISKEASPDSTDAMKRTVSGMLGILPSDQFHVTVGTSREPLEKLLVSSMMTGYTLRNAEYRLCLQKSLETSDDDEIGCQQDEPSTNQEEPLKQGDSFGNMPQEEIQNIIAGNSLENFHERKISIEDDAETLESLGPMSEETRNYVLYLKGKLMSVTKELEDRKRITSGLQVQTIVGEENNDLLDYLRSLAPDKVAELSRPTSQEVEEVIEHVISGLLDDPSTKLQHKDLQYGCPRGASTINNGPWDEDSIKKCSSSPLQSQSVLTVNRDYLARLLFWCMLLGHHMRGVEYRLELSRTLSLSGDLDTGT